MPAPPGDPERHGERRRAPVCRHCGAALDPARAASGVCERHACAMAERNREVRAFFKQGWNDHVRQHRNAVDAHGPEIVAGARELGVPLGKLAVGVVPRLTRPVVPLPPERRVAFLEHVRAVVAETFAEPVPAPQSGDRAGNEQPEPDFLNAACAACQGLCCGLGAANHAFLDTHAIGHVRRHQPELSAGDIVRRYDEMIPETSVRDSCVYHGPRGCVVPRDWRADVCNRFQCGGKRRIRDHRNDAAQAAVLWIASGEGADSAAAVVHDSADGMRPVHVDPSEGDTDPVRMAAAIAAVRAGLPELLPERAAPAGPSCRLCGAPITAARAEETGTCGSAACAHAGAPRQR